MLVEPNGQKSNIFLQFQDLNSTSLSLPHTNDIANLKNQHSTETEKQT